jgi:hypothetical protein
MTQTSVLGPFGKFDLANELGFDPMDLAAAVIFSSIGGFWVSIF